MKSPEIKRQGFKRDRPLKGSVFERDNRSFISLGPDSTSTCNRLCQRLEESAHLRGCLVFSGPDLTRFQTLLRQGRTMVLRQISPAEKKSLRLRLWGVSSESGVFFSSSGRVEVDSPLHHGADIG